MQRFKQYKIRMNTEQARAWNPGVTTTMLQSNNLME